MAVTARSIRDLEDALLRHQVFIQRLTAGERNKFAPFLKEMDRELRKLLDSSTEIAEYTRQRLQKLLRDVDGMLTEVLGDFQAQLLTSVDAIAANEAGFTVRALTTMIDVDAVTPGIQLIRSAVLNNPLSIRNAPLLKPFVKDWTRAQKDAVSGVIRRGVFQGQTNAQIVRAIRGTKALNYTDGLLDTTRRHAETLVHTAIQHASSQARQATFEENADIVKGSRWIATLDNASCATCRSLDQRVFPLNKGPRSPIHPNCRCVSVPVLDDRFAALQKGGTRPGIGQDGVEQVSASIDYYTWLKTQPAVFQDLVLGPKRGKLFREGGLSAERFAAMQLDKNWKALTLDQMKELEPIAFERAGL